MNPENSSSANSGKDPRVLAAAREVAEIVGREILESRLDPGAWATALAEGRGKKPEALAAYTRIRIHQLTQLHRMQKVKNRSFESRRLAKCMGDQETRESIARTIQEILHNRGRYGSLSQNYMKPRLSVLWLTLLFIGSAGTVASLSRLFVSRYPEFFNHPPVLLATLVGVATVWGALVLRYFLPKRWIIIGWNSGLIIACNLLCLCSLFLGTKLIKRNIASGAVAAPIHQTGKPAPKTAAAPKKSDPKPYLASTRNPRQDLRN